jgi:hypothetical protein
MQKRSQQLYFPNRRSQNPKCGLEMENPIDRFLLHIEIVGDKGGSREEDYQLLNLDDLSLCIDEEDREK